ncbi:MAG: ABC transporter ATP-binding protein [Gammaproteobacteria bacterium]|nr:ABC transporter ATP-binding protein [Gammaproteobacteria bacterium]
MLELENLSVAIDRQTIVKDASLNIATGKIGCLLGPSGSGKSTLLRCIAGFHRAASGRVYLENKLIESPHERVAVEERRIGVMFQDYALFPHLTVRENIGFGIHTMPLENYRVRLKQMLDLTELGVYADYYPNELSGGQQQRVALARALAPLPKLLLLDEPFSNIDSQLKLQLVQEIRELLVDMNITTLMVSHDQSESLAMSDSLGLMLEGRILQWSNTYDFYHRPVSRQVATFIGMGTMLRGTVTEQRTIKTALGELAPPPNTELPQNKEVDVLIRPDDIIHDDDSDFQATIEKKEFRGAQFLYLLHLRNGDRVQCFAPSHHNHSVGEKIGIRIDMEHVVCFPVA